ncbi:hypothetical protein DL98DRAFT_572177 [Cadophora sp. DSE1049]|nr:hypothetical protein DL98DRAFT_572177 [Cadophora sp. DSE1049]
MSAQTETHSPVYDYVYCPLGAAWLCEIRLIRLWPGPFDAEEVRLEIFHEIAFAEPQYEALSYAWGSPELTDVALVCEAIECRGKRKGRSQLEEEIDESAPTSRLRISHNLAVALRHLRFLDRERILWVDAISINQSDDAERSREVLQMGALYSNAKDVVVWLGPSSDDSTLALKTLARLGEGVVFYPAENRVTYEIEQFEAWAETLQFDEQALRAESLSWVAIGSLLRREWFERLWVFQEIALASSAVVVVGEYSIEWELFRLGVYWVWMMINSINRLPEAPNIENPRTNCLQGFLEVSDRNLTIQRNLLTTLHMTRRASCFDKRDRLFGIRDILYVDERQHIKPDYSLETEEVYTNTTVSLINSHERLYILKWCVLQCPPSDLKLPSWIPDFSFQGRPEAILSNQADGTAHSNHSIENGNVLIVHGVKVTEITQVVATESARHGADKEVVGVCRTWKQQLPSSTAYVTGSSMEDAFIEAVMCGKTQEIVPENSGVFPTTDSCKHVLLLGEEYEEFEPRKIYVSDGPDRERVMAELRRTSRGRSFFNTAGGHIGMCPDSAQCGDVVVVMLGCEVPLVLRPQPDCVDNFQVVGECYVPGIMTAEALLGQLPPGWTKRKFLWNGNFVILYEQGNIKTQKDPRIPALPSGWRIMFGTYENPLEVEPEDEKEWDWRWFENLETGERTRFNPAMTPELLRERGVDIREFKLV